MRPATIKDFGLSDDEMKRMIDGARVAFGSPDEYGNNYDLTSAPVGQPIKHRGKMKHAQKLRKP